MIPVAGRAASRGDRGGKRAGLQAVPFIPCSARGAAMEKFASPGKGNGLRLLKAVKPGELLYRAAPFAYIVSKKRLGGVCEHCLRRYWLSLLAGTLTRRFPLPFLPAGSEKKPAGFSSL